MPEEVKNIVISYSSADEEVANKLHDQLEAAGHKVWIDKTGLEGIVHWTQGIWDAIDAADGLVLVWSSNTTFSEDALEEVKIARVSHKPIFPILAYPEENHPPLPAEIRSLQLIKGNDLKSIINELLSRFSDPNKYKVEYTDLVDKGHIRKRRNLHFVGRKKELKELFVDTRGFRGESKKDIPISIVGLAGIGKTELALTFAYRFSIFFTDGVYWIDTPNGIVQEFEKIGPHLGITKLREERPLDYAEKVFDQFCQLKNGLLIFDNVTNIKEFRKWCPVGNNSCSVIITTRKSPRGFRVKGMYLLELDADSAYELIISRRSDQINIQANKLQQNAIKEICHLMGNHPLALEHCASYLQSEIEKPTELLEDLKKIGTQPLEHFASHPEFREFLNEGEANLLEILRRNYDNLDRDLIDPYFMLMCCFAPHGINTEIIKEAYNKPKEGKKALSELEAHSMIYLEPKAIYLHPLVAQFGKFLQRTLKEDYNKIFVEIIARFLRNNKERLSTETVKRELPHIQEALRASKEYRLWDECVKLHEYCAELVDGIDTQIGLLEEAYKIIDEKIPEKVKNLPNIRVRLGKALRKKGQPKEALEEFEKAEKLYDLYSDIDPAVIANFQFELGDVRLALGQYKEAEKTLIIALKTALEKASMDLKAPQVTRIQRSVAKKDLFTGDLDAAENQFDTILEHRLAFYTNHPDEDSSRGVISSYTDLCEIANERGNYKKAIEIADKAFDLAKQSQQESDPIFGDLSLLYGKIHFHSGDYKQASEYLENTKKFFFAIFGDKHPSYARSLIALGDVQRKLGKFNLAETTIAEAIETLKSRYSDIHPLITEALEVQGKIYNHQCKFEKEEKIWERILAIQTKVFSANHPVLANTYYNFANLYLKQGSFQKAIEHLESSIRIIENSLQKTHANYFGCLIRLAFCHYQQLEYNQAQDTLDKAQSLQKDIFGELDHPYVARMLQLQSEVHRRLGEFKEAEKSIDDAIEMKEAIYGENHPSVAEALQVKVRAFHRLGKIKESKTLINRALRIRKDHYGEEHPEVASSEHDLGSYYRLLGQFEEAIPQFEKAKKIVESVFRKTHPEYIERAIELADAHYEKGDYNRSLKEVKDFGKLIQETIQTENHYLKARWLFRMGKLHRRLGQFNEALDFSNQSIQMLLNLFEEDHPDVAEALEVQGKVYHHLGKFENEKQTWERIRAIQTKVFSANHPVLANTHYNFANFHLQQGSFQKAIEHLKSSIRIIENSLQKTHANYFESLVGLARCYYDQLDYTQAQDTLDKAQSLQKDIFGELDHPYVARMLQLQSEVHRRLGKFKEAEKSIDDAIEMKEAIYGENHPSVAEALQVKVRAFHRLGKIKESKTLINRALRIRKDLYGEEHPEVASSEHDLGSYYRLLGQFEEAIPQFEKAKKIVESVFGKTHPEYIERAIELADAHYEKGDYNRSLKEVKDFGKLIQETIQTENHYLKARWLFRMGKLHRRLGQFNEALDFSNQSIQMLLNLFEEDHPDVAEALEVQGKVYHHLGKFENEKQTWERIRAIQTKVFSANHPVLANTHYNFANFHLQQGSFQKAIEHLKSSIRIIENSLQKTHANYFESLVGLARCYYDQLDYTQAQDTLDKAHSLQKDIFGELDHPYVARMLQLQSEVHRRLGKFKEAEKSIDDAIEMKEAIYGENHPSVAEALEIKVDLNIAQLKTSESKFILDRIEVIRIGTYGRNHLSYANYQMRLSEFYSISGHYEEADVALNQSLKTYQGIFSSDHSDIIHRQVMSARLARISGEIKRASERIQLAKDTLGSRINKEESLQISSVLKESGNIRYKLCNYTSSLAEINRAIDIEERILGIQSPSVIDSMINKVKLLIVSDMLSEARNHIDNTLKYTLFEEPMYKSYRAYLLEQRSILNRNQYNYSSAIEDIDEAIKLKKEADDGKESVNIAKFYIEKAHVLRLLNKLNDSLDYLERAQNINNPHFTENHVYFARIFLERGRVYLCKKSHFNAKEHLEEALKIYRGQPELERREHAIASESLGLVFLETGYIDEASRLIKDAMNIKLEIFDNRHPEVIETFLNEALVVLKRKNGKDGKEVKSIIKQKLEKALRALNKNETNGTILKN